VRGEWKQRQGTHGDQVAEDIPMESPVSLIMDTTDGNSWFFPSAKVLHSVICLLVSLGSKV
jgi:hypothetical protein